MKTFAKKGLGLGLLNQQSQEQSVIKVDDRFDIIYVELDDLYANPKNEYLNMNGIDELSQSIMETGLLQNLVVRKRPEGGYFILSGHRRKAACEIAFEQTSEEKFHSLPCIVREPSDLVFHDDAGNVIEVSDDLKEELCIATTNYQQRKYTPAEMTTMMDVYRKIYGKMKAQAIDQETGEQISIGKERAFLAEQMGVSETDLHRVDYINHNASAALLEKFNAETVSKRAAYELAHQPVEVQEEVLEQLQDQVPTIETIKEAIDSTSGVPVEHPQQGQELMTVSELDFNQLTQLFLQTEDRIDNAATEQLSLSSKQYMEASKSIKQISTALTKLDKLIKKANKDNKVEEK